MTKTYVILDDEISDALYWAGFSRRTVADIIEEQFHNDLKSIIFEGVVKEDTCFVTLVVGKEVIHEIDLNTPFTDGHRPVCDGTYEVLIDDGSYDIDIFENGDWGKYWSENILGYKKLALTNKNL